MVKPVFIFFTKENIIVMTVETWDLSPVDVRWMAHPNLNGKVWAASVDMMAEEFIFPRDQVDEALQKYAELCATQLN